MLLVTLKNRANNLDSQAQSIVSTRAFYDVCTKTNDLIHQQWSVKAGTHDTGQDNCGIELQFEGRYRTRPARIIGGQLRLPRRRYGLQSLLYPRAACIQNRTCEFHQRCVLYLPVIYMLIRRVCYTNNKGF